MPDIVREPQRALGGITPDEAERLERYGRGIVERALGTCPVNRDEAVAAIKAVYAAAGFKKQPVVVVAPSPLVMHHAFAAAATVVSRHGRLPSEAELDLDDPTAAAVYAATSEVVASVGNASRFRRVLDRILFHRPPRIGQVLTSIEALGGGKDWRATFGAIRHCFDEDTDRAVLSATSTADMAKHQLTEAIWRNARAMGTHPTWRSVPEIRVERTFWSLEQSAAQTVCMELAGKAASDAREYVEYGHLFFDGFMSLNAFIGGLRDVIGLRHPKLEAHRVWEEACLQGAATMFHPDFCLVCDHPELLRMDDMGRLHCEDGPAIRWRDGTSWHFWHGVRIPGIWIRHRKSLTPSDALGWPDIEQRRAACEILGWDLVLRELDARVIDEDGDPEIGSLIEIDIPDVGPARFLRVRCGTGRAFSMPVPPEMRTALEANAWTYGFDADDFAKPELRT